MNKDDGSTTVQYAILAPLLVLLFLIGVQIGLLWYVDSLCETAAQQGLQSGRTVGGTTGDATEVGNSFLARAGNGIAYDYSVAASASTEELQVTASATALRVLPLPKSSLRVTHSVVGPKERYTVPGRRP